MEIKFNVDSPILYLSDKEKEKLCNELVKILEKNKMIIRKEED